jgi:hypothetical protein
MWIMDDGEVDFFILGSFGLNLGILESWSMVG